MSDKKKQVIGRAEFVSIPKGKIFNAPAKIDTGAWSTSVWATDIHEKDGRLYFTLFGESSPFYSGQVLWTKSFKTVTVENSFGHSEQRYRVMLSLEIAGTKIRATVNLANRENKSFPILVGRKLLRNKFVVDVAVHNAIKDEEDE